ncbi:hypothetical protein HG535_0G03350 [Zygotorulaspora mrakii]|uniref:Uncharacterized protein n=1 Tax=Zygotorulaspora mrakii TaxID=42260 RepID=A0A7H9B9Q0_ZYGMR|nr:uncharacterized protein HG535_0G03350 [Zygotorulaspora mrakii]QLG74452.1 hypothetical protein HG535_0G03350 [Zygotorulaspora mrakii]
MQCYIPLERSISIRDIPALRASHQSRQFVIFDEELQLVLHSENEAEAIPYKCSIWINDAKVHESQGTDAFEKFDKESCTWKLKSNICSQGIFRSSVVMNNGYNNHIKVCIQYVEKAPTQLNADSNHILINESNEEYEDFLPSFEPLPAKPLPILHQTAASEDTSTSDSVSNMKAITLKYPIYSMLNMRLRNVLQKFASCIISSLDFQTSKGSLKFAEKFLNSDKKSQSFRIHFDEVKYELVDRDSHIQLDPICPFTIPFIADSHDGYSISYKLPLPGGNNNIATNRAKITLRYKVVSTAPQLSFSIPVLTSWDTDVTLKRPMSNSLVSQASSNISTPRLYGVSPRVDLMGSASSLVNSKLNNVKFKFTNNKITAIKGVKFTLTLQIINSSSAPLDLVVYYNNKLSPPNQQFASMPLEKQYQLYKKYYKITEGIILLSNDFKVPIVDTNETYSIDLSFVGIMSGYYATLPGLKMVDLQTNELIEIGMGASVLIR